jgi:hypothetical protein
MMRSWLLAAGLLAAAIASPAQAADLDGDDPPPRSWPHSGLNNGPYAEPRYARPAPSPSYRDDDDDDDNDRYSAGPRPRKYSNVPPRYAPPQTNTCVRSEQVRDRLSNEGWRDFHDGKPTGDDLVTLRARRPSGRLFELTLHRCTGQLLESRPLQLRPFGPYAYRQPDRPNGSWGWGPQPQTAPNAYEDDDRWEERSSYAQRSYAQRGQRRWRDDD